MSLKHNWSFNTTYISGTQIKVLSEYGIEIISIEALTNCSEIELYLSGTFEQFENAKQDAKIAHLFK